jgi:prepilin-type N-terminal cleavage/methylation domain-containing protein
MNKNGFSLIELIIVMVLTAILAWVSSALLYAGFTNYFTAKKIVPMALTSNTAIDQIMRELGSAYLLTGATQTSVTYTNYQLQTIVISLVGTNLMRSVNGATAQVICKDVSSFSFDYYQENLTAATSFGNVRVITTSITVSDGTRSYAFITSILFRRYL